MQGIGIAKGRSIVILLLVATVANVGTIAYVVRSAHRLHKAVMAHLRSKEYYEQAVDALERLSATLQDERRSS